MKKNHFLPFWKKNNYYNYFPIIFINHEYYPGFLKYLKKSPKYVNFKNKVSFDKLLISSEMKYAYNHFEYKNIIAEIVENKDFYSIKKNIWNNRYYQIRNERKL